MQLSSRWIRPAAVTRLVAAAVAGCSSSGQVDKATSSGAAAPASATSGAAQAGLDPAQKLEPLATKTYQGTSPSAPRVKVDLVQLRPRGKVTQVVFALTLDAKAPKSMSVYDAFDERSPGISAVDYDGMMRYEAIESSYSDVGSDPVHTNLAPNVATYYWTVIPTPKAARVDVLFHDAMTPFENVPVAK